MGNWSAAEILFIIINIIVVALYFGFILSQNKLRLSIRVWISRIVLILAIAVLVMERVGLLGHFSMMAAGISIYWLASVISNMVLSDIWCCDKCGGKIGIRALFSNKCPYCHHRGK